MNSILRKEIKLSASVLSFLFIFFGFMFLIPGYPILCGAFFITLGIFQSFQNAREANDIVFSALLPINKRDIVKGKFLFSCMIEALGFLLMTFCVVLRMTLLKNAMPYLNNSLMNANFFALGTALVIFGLFNLVFIGGFFKTAYKTGYQFFFYISVCFLVIGLAETVHYIPGLEFFNAFGIEYFLLQFISLMVGAVLYFALTFLSYIKSCKSFDKIDL